jgi:hypothetical protein
MKLSVLVAAVIAAAVWALFELRPTRSLEIPRQARAAPPLPVHPPPPPPAPPATTTTTAPPQKAPPPPVARVTPSPLPRVARVQGRIIDENGRPRKLVKADFDAGGEVCIWVFTDDDGRFTVMLAPGSYEVTAIDGDVESPVTTLSLAEGEDVSDLVLTLNDTVTETDE